MYLFLKKFVTVSLWTATAVGALALLVGMALWLWPRIVCKLVAGVGIVFGFFVLGCIIRCFYKSKQDL